MTSQNLPTALKRSRDRDIDLLSEYVQNIERSAPNHACIPSTVTSSMDGTKMKKTMKAVNTTESRLPWLKEPD